MRAVRGQGEYQLRKLKKLKWWNVVLAGFKRNRRLDLELLLFRGRRAAVFLVVKLNRPQRSVGNSLFPVRLQRSNK